MNTVLVKDLKEYEGKDISLRGWLYGKRSGGKVIFLQVRDGSGICQCIVEAAFPEAFETADRITQESSLSVTGTVRKDTRSAGGYEIHAANLSVISTAQEYPITRKEHGLDFLMSQRHLWLRSRRPHAIMRIRSTLVKASRDFFDRRGFVLIDTPILVSGAGEDAQSLFPVEYFDRKMFLAQTGQLYLESACMAHGKVYCFGPTFRAEKSKTRRHLTEFWMIEPEIAFAELEDVMSLAEDMVCFIVEQVLEHNREDLSFLGRNIEALETVRKPFARLTYSAAVENLRSSATAAKLESEMQEDRKKLQAMIAELRETEIKLAASKKKWETDKLTASADALKESIGDLETDLSNRPEHIGLARNFQWGKDLGGSDETILSRQFQVPVFVTHYPKETKAFYMKQSKDDPRVVCNMDLLAPEGYGEIIGGSQREDNLETIMSALREKQLNPADYSWYLDLRKYGSVPHGGFGLGIERTLTWICGLKHVRETIPFPRTLGRIYP